MVTEVSAGTSQPSPVSKNNGKKKKKKNGGRVQGPQQQQQYGARQKKKKKKKKKNKMDEQQQGSRPGSSGGGGAEPARVRGRMVSTFRRTLCDFLASKDRVYTFDSSLSKKERAVVHEVSNSLGLKSKSVGRGNQRQISVYKRGGEFDGDKKENIPYLALSTEGKKILNDLFTRYPPSDGVETEAIEKGGIRSREKRKLGMQDDFFLKPSTNQAEIKKKVKSLSSRLEKDANLKQITEKRSKLPIASFKDTITSAVNSHQVVLISGETGCGKTTQVPQYLLDSMWAMGKACKIVCTQPRRISAISVAERISCERGENVGGDVGYKIRLESKGGQHSSVLFCTNGILLKVLVSHNSNGSREGLKNQRAEDRLSDITHIVVDEIHERDRFADLMLAILRDMLPSYPHLRLILMSATLDAERFANYFGGYPIIRVPGFTYPVRRFYLEDTLLLLQSKLDSHMDTTSASAPQENLDLTEDDKAALDDAINSAWIFDDFDSLLDLVTSKETHKVYNYQHSLTGMTPLIVFAGKGRAGDVLMLLSFGADCHLKARDGATAVDLAERENHHEVGELIKKHMESSFVNAKDAQMLLDNYLAEVKSELIDVILLEKLLKKICRELEDGAILVFLPGWEEISRVRDRLLQSPLFSNTLAFNILPLHSMIPSDEQKKVFHRPPAGCRKIILSTNIAETAITIDDVVYVIDCGRMKEKSYDPYKNVSTLESQWVSKASAKQRAGRAGRCQPGICYHLYSKVRAASLPDFPIPELRRMPIEELCLQVKILDPSCVLENFLQKTLDPPVPETIRNAILALQDIGALTLDEKLTELGEKLASLPVHPSTGRMIFFALLVNCLDPALTLACAYDCRDPFVLPMEQDEKKKADAAKADLASLYDGHSDHLAVVAAFECWKKAKEKGLLNLFCSQYFVSNQGMHMLFRMRKQLQRELVRLGYIPEDVSSCSLNARDPGIVHAVLVSGLYPMVGKLLKPHRKGRPIVEIANGDKASINLRSNNSRLSLKEEQLLLAFHEITRGDGGTYIRSSTVVGPLSVLLFAKEIAVAHASGSDDRDGAKSYDGDMDDDSGEDDERHGEDRKDADGGNILSSPSSMVTVVVDRWISFRLTALDIAQIYCLREQLSAAILFKVRCPSSILPPVFGAYMYALACLLSYDGLSGILSPSLKSSVSSLSTSKPNKMTKEPGREGQETQVPNDFLISLMFPDHHRKLMDIDYKAGLETVVEDRDRGSQSTHIHKQPLPFTQKAAFNVSTNERYGNGLPHRSYYQEIPSGNLRIFPFNGHKAGVNVGKRKVNGKGRSGEGIQQQAAPAYNSPNQKPPPRKATVLIGYGTCMFGPYGPTRGDTLKRQREIG